MINAVGFSYKGFNGFGEPLQVLDAIWKVSLSTLNPLSLSKKKKKHSVSIRTISWYNES